jgi:hypothetical protein
MENAAAPLGTHGGHKQVLTGLTELLDPTCVLDAKLFFELLAELLR